MIPALSLWTFIGSLFLCLFFYAIYSLILKPLYWIRWYQRQGAMGEFYPLIGGIGKRMMEAPATGDLMHTYKQILQETNPNVRLFATNLGSHSFLLLVDPKLIKEFLLKPEGNYVKSEIFTDLYRLLVGDGLVTSEGKAWKKHRKIVSNAFHFDFIKETVPVIVQATQEILDEYAAKDLSRVDVMKLFSTITGEIVGRIFFGQQFSRTQHDGKPLLQLIEEAGLPLVEETDGVWNGIFGSWFIKAKILPKHRRLIERIDKVRGIFATFVNERKLAKSKAKKETGDTKKDLLDILLDREAESKEEGLTTTEIIDEFLTFFIAGTDTSGHLLTIAMYHILQNSEIYQKTLEESTKVLKNEHSLSFNDIDGMNYTMAVLKETLRLQNPAFSIFFRRSLKDHSICDLQVKKGTLVTYFTNLNCLKEEYFDRPNEFDPDRWLSGNEANAKWKKDSYSYVPFSAGPRNCIGQHFALLETRIILGMFLKRFDVKISEGYKMVMSARFLYEPLDPLVLDLKVKEKAVEA